MKKERESQSNLDSDKHYKGVLLSDLITILILSIALTIVISLVYHLFM